MFLEAYSLAWILGQQGYHEEAEGYIGDALSIARQLGDMAWICTILILYSQLSRRQGKFDQAFSYCRQAQDLLSQVASDRRPYVGADIAYELGKIARDRGDWHDAQKHFLQAREIFSLDDLNPSFNSERAWGVLSQLGYIEHQLGNLDTAAQSYLQSLDYLRSVGSRGFITTLLVRFASLEEQRGNYPAALDYAREALEWGRRLGMVQELGQAEVIVGRLNR